MEPISKSSSRGVLQYTTDENQVLPPTTTYIKKSWVDSFTGWKNPDWRSQVERHVNAGTPMAGTYTSVDHSDGSLLIDYYNNNIQTPANHRMVAKRGWISTYGSFVTPSTILDQSADAEAAGKFYSSCRDALHALQGGELIGEMGKTAKSVCSLTESMVNGLLKWKTNVRRFMTRRWRDWASEASNAYLEWKFGWDPLAKDVRALMHDLQNDFYESTGIQATGRKTSDSQVLVIPQSLSIGSYEDHIRTSIEHTVRYVGELSLERTGGGGFAERIGLSPNNFAPTLYNLLPWTYMIDYFTNLGDIINSIGFPTHRIKWCVKTYRNVSITEVISGLNLKSIADNSGWKINKIESPQHTTWKTKYVHRDPTGAPPFPTEIRLKVPSVFKESGRKQWTNVAAVIATQTWSRSGFRGW